MIILKSYITLILLLSIFRHIVSAVNNEYKTTPGMNAFAAFFVISLEVLAILFTWSL
jgi:hypothetical protein